MWRVFSLSCRLEFSPWVLVFLAAGVKKNGLEITASFFHKLFNYWPNLVIIDFYLKCLSFSYISLKRELITSKKCKFFVSWVQYFFLAFQIFLFCHQDYETFGIAWIEVLLIFNNECSSHPKPVGFDILGFTDSTSECSQAKRSDFISAKKSRTLPHHHIRRENTRGAHFFLVVSLSPPFDTFWSASWKM